MIKASRKAPSRSQTNQEVDNLVTKHPGLRPLRENMLIHHQNYKQAHRQCPVTKDTRLDVLKTKYPSIRLTIIELFLNNETDGPCVYCGRISGDRLDHFHPKEQVPQYSLVPSNLFWSCNACNERKGNRLPFSDLKLFHPLFENLFRNRNILFDIKLTRMSLNQSGELILKLKVVPLKTLSSIAKNRVKFILRELGIKDRIVNRVDKQIRDFHRTVRKDKIKRPAFWREQSLARIAESKISGNYTDYFAYRIISRKNVLKQLLK